MTGLQPEPFPSLSLRPHPSYLTLRPPPVLPTLGPPPHLTCSRSGLAPLPPLLYPGFILLNSQFTSLHHAATDSRHRSWHRRPKRRHWSPPCWPRCSRRS